MKSKLFILHFCLLPRTKLQMNTRDAIMQVSRAKGLGRVSSDSMTRPRPLAVLTAPGIAAWYYFYPFFRSNSFINATSASTPSRGKAL
jgi:hypothetical protein